MEFEMLEFYPWAKPPGSKVKKNGIVGYLAVLWVDQGVKIQGLLVIKRNDALIFNYNFSHNYNKEEKRSVRFPTFSFIDLEKEIEFQKFLIEFGTPLVEKYLLENPPKPPEVQQPKEKPAQDKTGCKR